MQDTHTHTVGMIYFMNPNFENAFLKLQTEHAPSALENSRDVSVHLFSPRATN